MGRVPIPSESKGYWKGFDNDPIARERESKRVKKIIKKLEKKYLKKPKNESPTINKTNNK